MSNCGHLFETGGHLRRLSGEPTGGSTLPVRCWNVCYCVCRVPECGNTASRFIERQYAEINLRQGRTTTLQRSRWIVEGNWNAGGHERRALCWHLERNHFL